jgi:tetratricopeptide (TPR) repeat protein
MNAEHLFHQAQASESSGNLEEAVGYYKQLVSMVPDPRYFAAFGACLQRLGHWEQAARQLEQALDLKPHYGEADVRMLLAEAYLQLGHKSRAIAQWHRVIALPPVYPSHEAPAMEAKDLLMRHDT